MKVNFFKELFARLSSESPKFFNKLQSFGVYLASTGAALLLIPAIPHVVTLPHIFSDIAGYMITAGAVVKTISSLPVCNPEVLKEKEIETK